MEKGDGSVAMEGTLEEVLDRKFHVAMRWLKLQQQGKTLSNHLLSNGVKSIALYGITDFANAIIDELKCTSDFHMIKAVSDKKVARGSEFDYCGIKCVAPDELRVCIDEDTLVIVTPMGWQSEIKKELEELGITKTVLIQELIYEMFG